MRAFTVVGFYADDDSLQVTAVIGGNHEVVGGDGGEWQPWATFVEAEDPDIAVTEARRQMAEANDWEADS